MSLTALYVLITQYSLAAVHSNALHLAAVSCRHTIRVCTISILVPYICCVLLAQCAQQRKLAPRRRPTGVETSAPTLQRISTIAAGKWP
jgi:hypothetical protein